MELLISSSDLQRIGPLTEPLVLNLYALWGWYWQIFSPHNKAHQPHQSTYCPLMLQFSKCFFFDFLLMLPLQWSELRCSINSMLHLDFQIQCDVNSEASDSFLTKLFFLSVGKACCSKNGISRPA